MPGLSISDEQLDSLLDIFEAENIHVSFAISVDSMAEVASALHELRGRRQSERRAQQIRGQHAHERARTRAHTPQTG